MGKKLTALLLLLALCLTGCGEEAVPDFPQPEASVTPTPTPTPAQAQFSLPYYPDASLHPITGNNRSNLVLASLVYQGLFELNNSFTPQGVLCSEYAVSEDGLTWTFTLRNAAFSDGSPLTADDVADSLNLARDSALYAARLADVQRVRAEEDGTVTITLSRPNGALHALLDIPVIRDSGDGSIPLGTGPYAFVEDSGPLRLSRQDSAPDTAPEEIALTAIGAADDLIYAFDAGNVSLVTSDLTGSNALGYSAGYEVFSCPTTTMLYVGFQTRSGPCLDALVRQAVSRAFDRDTVAVSLLAGYADATCLPFSPRSELYSERHENSGGYDPDAAARLLEQAGYVPGEEDLLYKGKTAFSLTFVVNTDNSFKLSIAEYLAGQLTSLGIAVELQKLAWDDYLAALEQGAFDLYLGEVTLTADFDLTALLAETGALNMGGYTAQDPRDPLNLLNLLENLRAAQGTARPQAASTLLTQFQSELPFTPLCFKHTSVLTQWKAVSGLTPTRQNPFYQLKSLRFDAEA